MHQQTGKTTVIKRTVVRETGVSWHHKGSIEDLPETPRLPQQYGIEGLQGGPSIEPPLGRETRVSRTAHASFPS